MIDYRLREIHFEQAIESSELGKEIEMPLKKDRAIFFKLGMSEIKNEIQPLVCTFDANVDGSMSDKDFRHFAKTIIDQIKEHL